MTCQWRSFSTLFCPRTVLIARSLSVWIRQWGHGAVWTVLTAPTRNILTYLLTLDSTVSLMLSIHRFLGLPLGRVVCGFHFHHRCAVLLGVILLMWSYHLNWESSMNCRMLLTCSSALMSSFRNQSLLVTPLISLRTCTLVPNFTQHQIHCEATFDPEGSLITMKVVVLLLDISF